jgi:vacuolar-type H+-ATPase subunit H
LEVIEEIKKEFPNLDELVEEAKKTKIDAWHFINILL